MVATTRTVSRCGDKLDTAALSAVLSAVQNDCAVTTLRLCDAGLTPSLVVQLADFLEQNATLTHVDLSGNALDAHGASCLAASLAKNRTVTSLSLAKCRLQSESLAPWIAFFQAAAERKSKLTDLNLACNHLDKDSSEQLVALIRAAQTPHMRLDLRKNQLCGSDIRRLADALQTNSTIVRLQLDDNQNDDDDDGNGDDGEAERSAQDATLKQRSKIAFYLRRNAARLQRSSTIERIQQIQHSALEVHVCHFDAVNLSIADAELLGRALRDSRSVTYLRLTSNALPAEGAKRIFRGLHTNTSVRHLAVVDNSIGDVGMRALATLLRNQGMMTATATSPPLQSVRITNTIHLTAASGLLQPISSRTASLLYHTFASYAAIRSLTLANCALSDRDIGVVVSGIAWSARIQDLDLRNNAFGDATVHVFAHMLHRCRLFSRLDLSGNRFTLQGILPLAQAASIHPSIRTLLLGRISAEAASRTSAASAPASATEPQAAGTIDITSAAALIASVCTTLQQSFSLAQVELHVTTSAAAHSATDVARREIAALNDLLHERSSALRSMERDARAQADAVHTHRCRFRALVRQTAEHAVYGWCQR